MKELVLKDKMAKEKLDVEKILAEFESLENAKLSLLENFMTENQEKLGMHYHEIKIEGKKVKAVQMHTDCSHNLNYYFVPDTKEYIVQIGHHHDWDKKVQKSEIQKLDLHRVLKMLVDEYKYQQNSK